MRRPRTERSTSVPAAVGDTGVVPRSRQGVVSRHRVVELVDLLGRLEAQGSVTPHAEVLLPQRFAMTPVTRDGADIVSVVLPTDVEVVELGVRALVGLLAEPRHVARRMLATPRTVLSVLDAGLTDPLVNEPVRVRLPERRRRHSRLDTRALPGPTEALEVPLVTRPLVTPEFTQEAGLRVVRAARVVEPRLQGGDGDDEVDATLAELPVDVQTRRMVTVEDVADTQVVEFARAEAGFELDYDERLVVGGSRRPRPLPERRTQ